MSECVTKQMKIEAVKRERARLQQMEELGYEVDEAREQLDQLEGLIGNYKEMQAALQKTGRVQEVDAGKIAEANREKPRYKGAPVELTRIWTVDGAVYTNIKYKNGKEYTGIAAELITLDQKDLKGLVMFSAPMDEKPKKGRNILEKGLITDDRKMLKVFDELVEMDKVEQDVEHVRTLREVLKKVAGPLAKALPEIAVHLDETASRNSGMIEIGGKEADIYLGRGLSEQAYGGEMTLVEKYVHEVIHAATYWAMRSENNEAARIRNRLMQLHERAMKELTVEDLLPEVSINAKAELEVAKQTYKYINENIEEFVAYAMTNKKVMGKLATMTIRQVKEEPKGFLNTLIHWLGKLVDMVVMKWRNEPKDMKADKLAVKLVHELMQINNEVEEAKQASLGDKLEYYVDKIDNYIAGKIDQVIDKQMQKAIRERPVNEGKLAEAVWVVRTFAQLVGNKDMAGQLRGALAALGLKPEGTVQNLLQKLKNKDQYQEIVEEIGLMSLQIDKNRETTATQIDKIIAEAFKQYDRKTQKLLYRNILTLDGVLLVNKYGDGAGDFYRDEKKLETKIAELEKKLEENSTKQELAYYKYQIEGLAKYMETGEGSLIQLKNAEAIAMMAGTRFKKSTADGKVKDLIDELASLKAVKNLDMTAREQMVELFEREAEGIKAMAAMRKGFDEYMSVREAAEDRLNRRKGYVRETYDRYVTTTVARVEQKKEMEEKGYKLVKTLPVGAVGPKVVMGLYVNTSLLQLPFNRSGVRYTGEKQQGRSLFEHRVKLGETDAVKGTREDLKRANAIADKLVEDVMAGRVVKDNMALSPHVGEDGKIKDYRYNVSTEDKLLHMKLSTSPSEAIGRNWAHQIDVEESQGLNDVAWQEMMKDMAKNYVGGMTGLTGDEYILIDVNSQEEIVRDIARIMPEDYKEKIRLLKKAKKDKYMSDATMEKVIGEGVLEELKEYQKERLKKHLLNGKFAVRRDMLTKIFGFRDLSAVDMAGIKHLPKAVKNITREAENVWKEFVSLYSVNVVIKTLAVPVENVVSNFMYVLVDGHGVAEVMKAQIEGWKGLNQWIKDEKRQRELVALMHAHPENRAYRDEMGRITARMQLNPVKPLVDAGLYQHIMEDVGTGDFSSSSRLANWVNAKTENWPELLKLGVNYAFVTENTWLFRAMQKFVMFGDFVARYSQYVLGIQKEKRKRARDGKPFTPKELEAFEKRYMREITKNFINYADPDSQLWQYVQDMGFARFTKYGIGIQNVIREQAMKHPFRFAMAIAGQEGLEDMTGYNPASVDEMSWLTGKGLFMPGPTGMMEHLVDNMFPIYGNIKGL